MGLLRGSSICDVCFVICRAELLDAIPFGEKLLSCISGRHGLFCDRKMPLVLFGQSTAMHWAGELDRLDLLPRYGTAPFGVMEKGKTLYVLWKSVKSVGTRDVLDMGTRYGSP